MDDERLRCPVCMGHINEVTVSDVTVFQGLFRTLRRDVYMGNGVVKHNVRFVAVLCCAGCAESFDLSECLPAADRQ